MSVVEKCRVGSGPGSTDKEGSTYEQHVRSETPWKADDLLALESQDPALNAKIHVVNDAIDEIGWVNYHWKVRCAPLKSNKTLR